MIFLFHGFDSERKSEAVRRLLGSNSPADFFKITDLDFEESKLEGLISASSLFNDKLIVLLENVLTEEKIKSFILERLNQFRQSANLFIFSELELSKRLVDEFKEFSQETRFFPSTAPSVLRFDVFSLTDFLGRRDRKNCWVSFQRALFAGVGPEEILPIIFWQIKAMILALGAANYSSHLGIKPFVFKKAKSFSRNFSGKELRDLSSELVYIFHQNRRQSGDLKIDLEKFILEALDR